ncbi:FAD-binding protein [Sphingobacterium sp.]|uniref:UDP-N-acetylmuramate dehydrogenase n=1 Tax=Sphingobacterium sp. TaxID=341027 RepID=UPI0031DF9D73
MDKLLESLHFGNVDFEQNVDLAKYTYMKTGGIAKLLILPKTTEEVIHSIKSLNEYDVAYKIIGATSNLLFLDNADYTCLLSTTNLKGIEINQVNNEIISRSGEMLGDLSRFALLNSVTGFEGLEGIPGTVGGAVFMNAGAYGYETKNVLKSIELVDPKGNINNLRIDDLGLKYRNSALKRGEVKGVVVSATFKIEHRNQSKIEARMELFHSKRHKYQEFLFPNLGSCFSGSIYRALGKKDRGFKLISMLYFLFAYKVKLFRRESPINRKWINDIALKRFNFSYEKQPFSNKNINTMVNRGQGTDEMLRFIDEINRLADFKIPIENEIVEKF